MSFLFVQYYLRVRNGVIRIFWLRRLVLKGVVTILDDTFVRFFELRNARQITIDICLNESFRGMKLYVSIVERIVIEFLRIPFYIVLLVL